MRPREIPALQVHDGMTRQEISEAIKDFQQAFARVHEAIGLWVSVLEGYADEIDARIEITRDPKGVWNLRLGPHAVETAGDLGEACEAMIAPLLDRDFKGPAEVS